MCNRRVERSADVVWSACIEPANPHNTVNTVNNADAVGNWATVPNATTSEYLNLKDELGLLLVEYVNQTKVPTNASRVKDFFTINVKYVPSNLQNGLINTLDFGVFLEAYGRYSSAMGQGSSRDVLLLPRLPNVTTPTLRLDIDNNPPTYYERLNALPTSMTTKSTVTVVKGPAYYVCIVACRAYMFYWCFQHSHLTCTTPQSAFPWRMPTAPRATR